MPVFICSACNETLKVAKVATHNCRGCWYFSCMDCNKTFSWEDYKTHTSCVTEAERYQGALYVPKDNKGEVKQQSWLAKVHSKLASDEGNARLRPYMERLLAYDNVPRKRAKFINFAKNSLNLKADRDGIAEKLWDVIGATDDAAADSTAVCVPCPDEPGKEAAEKAAAEKAAAEAEAAKMKAVNEAEKIIQAEKEAEKAEKAAKKAAKAEKKAAKAAGGSGGGAVPYLADSDAFDEALAASKRDGCLLALDFTATWCGPCREIGPAFAAMAGEFPHVRFAKVDVDAADDVAERCRVSAMPTFQFFRDGAKVGELCGAEESKLRKLVAKLARTSAASSSAPADALAGGASGGAKRGAADAAAADAGGDGKRQKGAAPPVLDAASTKPIKWKKIITKELQTEGGSMGLKALRKACVAEVRAHPTHKGGKDRETLKEEFDAVLPTFHKFQVDGEKVRLNKDAKEKDD